MPVAFFQTVTVGRTPSKNQESPKAAKQLRFLNSKTPAAIANRQAAPAIHRGSLNFAT